MAQSHARERFRRALGKIFFAYATEVGAQKPAAQIGPRARHAAPRLGGNSLDEPDAASRDSAQDALFGGGRNPRVHDQVLFCRSLMSAARNLTASPPVTQR